MSVVAALRALADGSVLFCEVDLSTNTFIKQPFIQRGSLCRLFLVRRRWVFFPSFLTAADVLTIHSGQTLPLPVCDQGLKVSSHACSRRLLAA